MKGFAIVPYIQGIVEPIMRILKNCGIKIALKPIQTLGHIFAIPKDRVPTDHKTHAVNSTPCDDCEKEYLGQTKRQFCSRLKEHQRAVSYLYSSSQPWRNMCAKQAIKFLKYDLSAVYLQQRESCQLCPCLYSVMYAIK